MEEIIHFEESYEIKYEFENTEIYWRGKLCWQYIYFRAWQ